jgi:maleate isomerase
MIGHRARIGICSPPLTSEIMPYEFYQLVPEGVTLMLTTLSITTRTPEEIQESFERSLRAARYMAGGGADVVVLSGKPINQSLGGGGSDIIESLSNETGIPVLTSTALETEAFRALGARKIAVVHPYASDLDEKQMQFMRGMGFEAAGVIAAGYSPQNLGQIGPHVAFDLAQKVKEDNPAVDTIHLASGHWPSVGSLAKIERELGVNATSTVQATVWKALRVIGIADPIEGYGRLLSEF